MISQKASEAEGNNLTVLSLAALGVVFGDIGTSPLYALKTAVTLSGGKPDRAAALGILSLVVWTLIIVTTIKYVSIAMRIDNDGEGGILALMSLLGTKRKHRPAVILTLGLVGAALLYGDGAVTPAISVLSALEGLNIVAPAFSRYVLPCAVVILAALFLIQSKGTAWIGKGFGPIMLAWFLSIGALGIGGIVRHPSVLMAINPLHAILYLSSHRLTGFLVLGGVFLCVTGAEALYADMGQFGPKPIRLAWTAAVFPSLVLNYAGQTALVLQNPAAADNSFYRLCPSALLVPMVVLATVATIIASQSIITGVFSMTQQAMQLGFLPRLKVKHTSPEGSGQIYVEAANWMLMMVTCGLALGFKKSGNLAAAYGIAVAGTMLATSALLFVAMREIWKRSLWQAGAVAGIFVIIDATFFAANTSKVVSGGYVPLLLGGIVYAAMLVWHRGAAAVSARLHEKEIPVNQFMADLSRQKVVRVPGTAVFLTHTRLDVPPTMAWYVTHSGSLHENVFALTVETEAVPWARDSHRLKLTEIAPQFWRAHACYGYMEEPDIPALLRKASEEGCTLDLSKVVYHMGFATILPREDGKGMPGWEAKLFAAMQRNSVHMSDYLRLPAEAVVEIGKQVYI